MTFPLVVACGYPSYEEAGTKWIESDYRAWGFIKAIKRLPYKGYAQYKAGKVENTPAGQKIALSLAAKVGLMRLKALGITGGALVPLPSSSHTVFNGDFTGGRIAAAMAELDPSFAALPVLAFKSVMPKASGEGGTRSAAEIDAALKVAPLPLPKSAILIDDVVSTRGHLRGAARFLEKHGVHVTAAYCVAQTVWARPANIFNIETVVVDTALDYFEL